MGLATLRTIRKSPSCFPLTEVVVDILEVAKVGNGVLSADETVVVDGRHAQQVCGSFSEFGASPAVADRLTAATTRCGSNSW